MSQSRPPLAPLRDQLTSVTLQQPVDQPSSPGQDGDKIRHMPSIVDLLLLAAITIMLVWPWAFFGAVWIRHGVQLSNHMTKVVTKNPHATTYSITLICSIIAMFTSALFSLAILRFAQELVTHRKPTRPFHLRVLLAFRHQNWPWGKSVKGAKYLIHRHRWWPAVLLIVCILAFPHLISSTASLLTPIPFNRTADLNGTEINFSSVDCHWQDWLNNHPLPAFCDYQLYKGLPYTNCFGANQLVDMLEAGRGSILELATDNNEIVTFSQLSGGGGLHFLGSIRGVLPNGPNGVPGFNTLDTSSPFSNSKIMAGVASYNYTLNQQGFNSSVSCRYVPTSQINITRLDDESDAISYDNNVTCAKYGMSEVLFGPLQAPYGANVLEYWACQSASNAGMPMDSYTIYLAGRGIAYDTTIANITCTLTQVQTAIFPVKYDSTTNVFSAAKQTPGSYQAITYPIFMSSLLTLLGEVVVQGQNFEGNLVAESVLTFAYKSFNVAPNTPQSPKYLELFEQMIQGIIEYEVSYLRLIYSTVEGRPSNCTRTLTGSAKYQVFGWFVSRANIGFLIPITIINGAAFVALVLAMWIAWTGEDKHHPFHPRPVVLRSDVDEEERVPSEWERHVAYSPATVLKEYFENYMAGEVKQGVKAVAHGLVGEKLVAGPSGSHREDIAPVNDRPQQDIAPADDTLQENVARY